MNPFKWVFATAIGWRLFLIVLIGMGLYIFSGEVQALLGGVVDRIDYVIGYQP